MHQVELEGFSEGDFFTGVEKWSSGVLVAFSHVRENGTNNAFSLDEDCGAVATASLHDCECIQRGHDGTHQGVWSSCSLRFLRACRTGLPDLLMNHLVWFSGRTSPVKGKLSFILCTPGTWHEHDAIGDETT